MCKKIYDADSDYIGSPTKKSDTDIEVRIALRNVKNLVCCSNAQPCSRVSTPEGTIFACDSMEVADCCRI